jgi:phage terminase Nu1 subunit (DNA packaging protein)
MKRKKKAWNRSPIVGSTISADISNQPSLISAEQAADYLNVTIRTLANWRSRGFPNLPYCKIGRCIRYRLADLDVYIAKHSHNVEAVK